MMRRTKLRKRTKPKIMTARAQAGPVHDTMRHRVYQEDFMQCCYCGSSEFLSVDHVVPVSLGGKSRLDNLVTACRSCNSKKGAKTAAEAGLSLSWGRYFKIGAERGKWLQKWIQTTVGIPEKQIVEQTLLQGITVVELAWIYAKRRNWTMQHSVAYLMQNYHKELRGR